MAEGLRIDVDKAKAVLKRRVLDRMPKPGMYESGLAGVRLYRRDRTTEPQTCFYQP